MIFKQSMVNRALKGEGRFKDDRLHVIPCTTISDDKISGASTIDLRLGRWFQTLKPVNETHFDVTKPQAREMAISERHFIRFGTAFVLHPGHFALGVTLEWIRIPSCCAASVVGKSSWGRRGLIIETAPTVHPGFSGCLTLELTNVGTVPIMLYPGLAICQLQISRAIGIGTGGSMYDGKRRPVLGSIRPDEFFTGLSSPKAPAQSG